MFAQMSGSIYKIKWLHRLASCSMSNHHLSSQGVGQYVVDNLCKAGFEAS